MNQYKVFVFISLVMMGHSFPLLENYNAYSYSNSCRNSTVVLYENDIKVLQSFVSFVNSLMSHKRYANKQTEEVVIEGKLINATMQTTGGQATSTSVSSSLSTTATSSTKPSTTMTTTTTTQAPSSSSSAMTSGSTIDPFNPPLLGIQELSSDYVDAINPSSTLLDPTTQDEIKPSSSSVNPSSTATSSSSSVTTNNVSSLSSSAMTSGSTIDPFNPPLLGIQEMSSDYVDAINPTSTLVDPTTQDVNKPSSSSVKSSSTTTLNSSSIDALTTNNVSSLSSLSAGSDSPAIAGTKSTSSNDITKIYPKKRKISRPPPTYFGFKMDSEPIYQATFHIFQSFIKHPRLVC